MYFERMLVNKIEAKWNIQVWKDWPRLGNIWDELYRKIVTKVKGIELYSHMRRIPNRILPTFCWINVPKAVLTSWRMGENLHPRGEINEAGYQKGRTGVPSLLAASRQWTEVSETFLTPSLTLVIYFWLRLQIRYNKLKLSVEHTWKTICF